MLQRSLSDFRTVYRSIPLQRVIDEASDRLREHLRAVVVLAGSVRTDPLAQAARRARVGLPISADQTLVQHWVGHTRQLARHINRNELELRLLLSRGHALNVPTEDEVVRVSHHEDCHAFRGTGGILHDLARELQDSDLILIISGAQLMQQPLGEIAVNLARLASPVTVTVRDDATPCDLTLASVKALRTIRGNGYIDFKEQALPEMARTQSVGVMRCAGRVTLPVRTLAQYVGALRIHHQKPVEASCGEAFADSAQSRFAIVEAGAELSCGVRVLDSVVLSGARVGDESVIVRSVIGPTAVVPPGSRVIDELVGP